MYIIIYIYLFGDGICLAISNIVSVISFIPCDEVGRNSIGMMGFLLMSRCSLKIGWPWWTSLKIKAMSLVGGLEQCLYIGNNNPNWLIFFRVVETTNQATSCWEFMSFRDPKKIQEENHINFRPGKERSMRSCRWLLY